MWYAGVLWHEPGMAIQVQAVVVSGHGLQNHRAGCSFASQKKCMPESSALSVEVCEATRDLCQIPV